MQEEIGTEVPRLWPIAPVWAIFLALAGIAYGQPGANEDLFEPGESLLVPAPREWRQELARAEQAIGRSQFADAVTILGNWLLDDGALRPAEDYFLLPDGDGGSAPMGLRQRAEQLIGRFPEAGRELYELQFGANAQRELQEALNARDLDGLAAVVRQYFHTTAGYQAALALGRARLDQGQPLAAIRYLEKLANQSGRREAFEPQLTLLLASAWHLMGEPQKARSHLDWLRQHLPAAQVVAAGQARPVFGPANITPAPLFAVDQEPPEYDLAVLETLGRLPLAQRVDQWTMPSGAPSRNVMVEGSMPVSSMQWSLPVAIDQAQREQIDQVARRLEYQRRAALPVFVPLVVDSWLVMRGLDVVYGVDLATGRRVWQFPWDGSSLTQDALAAAQPASSSDVAARLMHDAVLGQLSSDGKRVFVILPDHPPDEPVDLQAALFQAQAVGADDGPTSRLCALELESQGKLVWSVGGMQGGSEPELAQTFFLGTPLASEGKLYCLAERRGELRLVVLDAASGKLLWSQQLVHVGPEALEFNPLRQQVGAVPSLSGGILVCPTMTGVVVAVDVDSRRLLWAHEYHTGDMAFRRTPRFQLRQQAALARAAIMPALQERWIDSTAVLAGDRVVVTPADSEFWICLDLRTGQLVGRPHDREDLLYLAGIRQGGAVFVGTEEVTCLDLETGEERWSTELPDSSLVAGRGIMAEDHLYLPTTMPELIQVDLGDGSLVRRIPWKNRLGNLVSARGLLVSQSADHVQVYYQRSHLEAEVARRLETDPHDPWALLHQGILQREADGPDQALASLREAREALPEGDPRRGRVDREMMETLLAAMQESPKWNPEWWQEAQDLPREPHQQMVLQRLLAQHYIATQQWQEAVSLYVAMVDDWLDAASANRGQMDRFGRNWMVRRDRWLRAGLQDVLEQGDASCRELLQQELQRRLAGWVTDGQPHQWQQLLSIFPHEPACQPLALKLAEHLRRQGNLILAERYASQALEHGGEALRGAALVELAQVFGAARRFSLARQVIEQLRAEDLMDTRLPDGRTAQAHLQLLERRVASSSPPSRDSWPAGEVDVRKQTTTGNQRIALRRLVPREVMRGFVDRDVQLINRQSYGGGMLQLVDGRGDTLMQLPSIAVLSPSGFQWPRWQSLGHAGILRIGFEFVAFDWLSPSASVDRVLWTSIEPSEQEPSTAVRFGPQGVSVTRNVWNDLQETYIYNGIPINVHDQPSPEGLVLRALAHLRCVDPWSGETLWERGEISAGASVWGDDQLVLVAPHESPTARILRRVDGREIGQCEVPEAARRWAYSGRAVLTWDDRPDGGRHLRLWDPVLEQEQWGLDVAPKTRGCVVSADQVALLEPTGRLRILDLATGQVRVDLQVPHVQQHARELRVVRIGRDYAVVGNLDSTIGRPTSRGPFADQFFPAVKIDGWLWMVDEQGRPRWQIPAFIDGYHMPLEQPRNAPLLILLRNDSGDVPANTGRRAERVDMVCLDRRDGRLLAQDPNLGSVVGNLEIAADPARHQASIELHVANRSLTYTLRWTDQPRPPEPPVQLGEARSQIPGSPPSRALRVVGSMLGALGTQALRIVDPEGALDELGEELGVEPAPEMEDLFEETPLGPIDP